MSNRWFALAFTWLAAMLGWLWQIADSRDLAVAPFGYGCFISLVLWLWSRLERLSRQPSGEAAPSREADRG